MISHKTRTMACSIIFGLCLLNSAQANAQTARVAYRPYELTSDAGAKAVAARIQRSVSRACRPDSTDIFSDRRECMADLSSQLLARINSPVLTAQWNGSHGRTAGRG